MNDLLHIGKWTVLPELGRIRSTKEEVALEPRLMRLLLYLAAHPGMVLPKEHLLDVVWKGVFVAENTLMNAVSELRKALGDDVRAPRFIRTHARRGYRLIAPVKTAGAPTRDPAVSGPRVLAMPFSSYGQTDTTTSVLAGELTETVITLLTRSRTVEIVSQLSVSSCRRHATGLPELAQRLAVDFVLEGAISITDRRVRVSARLFDCHERGVWGELMEYESEPRPAIKAAALVILDQVEATARAASEIQALRET